ncbi:hypothetical protein [Ensifer canadensis]
MAQLTVYEHTLLVRALEYQVQTLVRLKAPKDNPFFELLERVKKAKSVNLEEKQQTA